MNADALAIVTLVIAVVGLVVSVVSLSWQVVQHFLSGDRVTVELRWGGLGGGAAVTGPVGSDLTEMANQGFSDLVFAVRARNRGRLAVDVTGFSVGIEGGVEVSPTVWNINPALPHRLQLGSSADFFIPLDQVMTAVSASQQVMNSRGKVRAVVELGSGRSVTGDWRTLPRR